MSSYDPVEDLLIRFLRQKNELSVSEKLFAVRPFSGYETEPKTLKFGAKSSLEIFFWEQLKKRFACFCDAEGFDFCFVRLNV